MEDYEGEEVNRKIYAILEILGRLGYTLSLKSMLNPDTLRRFLGFMIDTQAESFKLPSDKQIAFGNLRKELLGKDFITLRDLQRLAGKCASMAIAIPGALFYTREMNLAISKAQKNSKPVALSGPLREEIEHWNFIDNWEGEAKWRTESHISLSIATDASMYRWAGTVLEGKLKGVEVSDYFLREDNRPIHIKETVAVINTLKTLGTDITGSRVDLLVDNQSLIAAYKGQGSKVREFNDLLKELFELTVKFNIDLKMDYINTSENPADAPSRVLSAKDARLSQECWVRLQNSFGPHTCDLMALDSNSMKDENGEALRHFTPHPMPASAGINVFAQEVELEVNPYVFPPISMIPPVLNFLKERRVAACTIVLPIGEWKEAWYPKVIHYAIGKCVLGKKGEKGILWYPSKNGWEPDKTGLRWDLVAFRLCFTESN